MKPGRYSSYPSVFAGLLLLFVSVLFACVRPSVIRMNSRPAIYNESGLEAAAEAFYSAPDLEAMREAVARANEIGPRTAIHHELAANLAIMEADPATAFDHLVEALLDPSSDAADYHIEMLDRRLHWTLEEQRRALVVLGALRRDHPSHDVRARAAWHEAHLARVLGEEADRSEAVELIRPLPLAIIGVFDNDQGKGFEMEYPPELDFDPEAQYPGYRVDAVWRKDVPSDTRGHTSLSVLLHPDTWQVAYAATAFSVSEAGSYELRITTSAPIKVWVNDTLVFQNPRVGGTGLFDGVRVPLELEMGASRVLVKSGGERGDWRLLVRMTKPNGERLSNQEMAILPVDHPPSASAPIAHSHLSDRDLISLPFANMKADTVRLAIMRSWWSEWLALKALRVEIVEEFAERLPDSLMVGESLARATWNNQERDRAADLLNHLSIPWEKAPPEVLFMQANFWRQQDLHIQSRNLLMWMRDNYPQVSQVLWWLAAFMSTEGWHEERCRALEEKLDIRPGSIRALRQLAACFHGIGYYERFAETQRHILAQMPNDQSALRQLATYYRERGHHRKALALARHRVSAWPASTGALSGYGDALRAAGDLNGAEDAWRRLIEVEPLNPRGYLKLGRLAIERDELEEAAALLKEALDRDPESSKLAERIALLSSDDEAPWIGDVPGPEKISAVLAARAEVEGHEDADVVVLLYDIVTNLSPDGIATNIITVIARAENETGRDELTRQRLWSGRHHRVLSAYAVGSDGRRIEASSIHGHDVRFRELSVGSTIVLQYRLEERRRRFLQGHYAARRYFGFPKQQVVNQRWVVWAPQDTVFNEHLSPEIERDETSHDGHRRLAFIARDLPPLIPERGGPPIDEILVSVALSTVPNWEVFASWERALLMDAFRSNPEIEAFTRELIAGAETAEEKLNRIYSFVIQEIRYQQDYARPITGVKPHPAPVTFARRYGDCKDKAVLVITMAEIAGLELHFALVKTRPAGFLLRSVPMQQFNHAIVYLPEQEGIEQARFLDATVDDMDLAVLRQDNPGTFALVFDRRSGGFDWREVPFQPPDNDFMMLEVQTFLRSDEAHRGRVRFTAQGRSGSLARRQARNPEGLRQASAALLPVLVPGARLVEVQGPSVRDLTRPVVYDFSFEGEEIARVDGERLRIPLPMRTLEVAWGFQLPERRYPVVFGAPYSVLVRSIIHLPEGMEIESLPPSATVEVDCLTFERRIETGEGLIRIDQQVSYICERVLPEDYGVHKVAVDRIERLMRDEVILQR